MQQGRGSGGSDQNMKQNQDRGLKPPPLQPPSQQQEPQKCPRCDSVNTKFCYYNNYSLSQPRYFCKTCRRYWTQGGTQRNVPVGGGCRKAAGNKRTKISYSSSAAAADQNSSYSPPPPLPQIIPHQQNLTSTSPQSMIIATSSASLASPLSAAISSSTGRSYYPGGGFLSSLAAIQSMNQPPPPANPGAGELGISSSSLGLLQGYGVPSFGSQLQHHHQPIINRQTQFFDMGNTENIVKLNYPSNQQLGLTYQPSRPAPAASGSSSSTKPNWHQNFLNEITNPKVVVSEEANLWSINSGIRSSTTTDAAGNTNTTTCASFNPNHCPHFPGYGAP